MSTAGVDLNSFSQALVELVAKTSTGVVAVKSGPYRTTSGVVLGNNLVAVANHALKRENSVPIQTAAGTEGTGTILGREPALDLAILRLDGSPLEPLAVRDSATLKAGDLAAVVGLTTDAGPSASLGILGAVGGARRIWRGGTLDHFLRLDVNLYPSQSGAAVVDASGGLIGMAAPAILRHSALALPFSTLKLVADELLQQGRIRRGYLGVGVQPVPVPLSLRQKVGISDESGLMVLSVENESPADKAGWQLGDILISLSNLPMTDVDELQNLLRGDTVGRRLEAVLIRGGERTEAAVVIQERPGKAK